MKMMPTDMSLRLARSTRRLWPIFPVQTRRRRGFFTSLSGRTFSKAGLPNSATGDEASGWRSMLLGVKTTSGLRQGAKSLTAEEMEVLRGVRRLCDDHVVAGAKLEEAFHAG